MKKEIVLKNSLSETTRLEQFIESLADMHKINDATYANMIIASLEAFNNAYVHGNKKDPAKSIVVSFEETVDYFILRVKDEGEGFNFEEQIKNVENTNGLFIIQKVCDEVRFQEQGSLIEMIFYKQALPEEFFTHRKNIFKEKQQNGTKHIQKHKNKR